MLRPGPGGLCLVPARRTHLDVHGRDAQLLALDGHVLRGKHGRVRGRLVTIGLDLHPARDTGQGLPSRQISDMHKGVVEGGKDVGDAKYMLPFSGLGAQVQGGGVVQLGGSSSLCLFRWLGRKNVGGEDDEDLLCVCGLSEGHGNILAILIMLYIHRSCPPSWVLASRVRPRHGLCFFFRDERRGASPSLPYKPKTTYVLPIHTCHPPIFSITRERTIFDEEWERRKTCGLVG